MSAESRADCQATRPGPSRFVRTAVIGSLGLTLLLWILALLFKLRMVGFFQSFLMKKIPGPAVTFGAMVVCPAIATVLGIVSMRRRQGKWLGLSGVIGGGL